MLASETGSRLLRFLLSLVIRFRQVVGHIALALRARFASFWRSILSLARRRGQSRIQLHASSVPVVDNNTPISERPRISEEVKVEANNRDTLAALPMQHIANWQDKLSRYQDLTLAHQFRYDPHPATPGGGSQRYKPRRVSQTIDPPDIPAGQEKLLSVLPPHPSGWRRHVHPEGNVLFYHEELRIFTECDISDHRNCTEILLYATALIQQAIDTNGVIMDGATEIVLNVDDKRKWHYYFVDPRNCLLFWVHPVRPHDLGTSLQRITGHSHIRYLVEARYWYASLGNLSGMSAPVVFYLDTDLNPSILHDIEWRSHCEYYPHNRILPRDVFHHLTGMLNYARTDMLTGDSSTSSFTQDELGAILDVVNSLKDDDKTADPYSIWIIARLMAFFTEDQFLKFRGPQSARLNTDTQLFAQQIWNRSTVFKVVNVFLFGAPNEHALRLQRVWADTSILRLRWKDCIIRMKDEMSRCTILSTVMLAVNVGFLAVLGASTPGFVANPSEIIIYCSVACTIASIIFSFTLSNLYSDPGLVGGWSVADAMRALTRTKWGMPCLAIMHSFPVVSLMWSVALFSTALAIWVFGSRERATVSALGATCLILMVSGAMSGLVIQLLCRNDDVDDVEPRADV